MKILIIRRDHIGDLVCTTPLIEALRKMFPEAFIGALVNSYNADVLLGNPHINKIHVYTKLKHRPSGRWLLGALLERLFFILELRKIKYDFAILPKSQFDAHGLQIAAQIGIADVIGYAPESTLTLGSHKRLKKSIIPQDVDKIHHVDSLWPLLKLLGNPPSPGPLRVYPLTSLVEQKKRDLSAVNGPLLALHISARHESRRLGTANWIKIIQDLHNRCSWLSMLLIWSPGNPDDARNPGDDQEADKIINQCRLLKLPITPCPTRQLRELIALLSLCHGFIGADGGALHIAAALQLPCVALFENLPQKYKHWYPWQTRYESVISPNRDICDIDPMSVVDAWIRLMNNHPITSDNNYIASHAYVQ